MQLATSLLIDIFGIIKFFDFGFWFLLFKILKLFKIKLNEKNQNLLSLIGAESFSAPSAPCEFLSELIINL
jgi:hypothetical protein